MLYDDAFVSQEGHDIVAVAVQMCKYPPRKPFRTVTADWSSYVLVHYVCL